MTRAIAIVVPAYNEELTLLRTLRDFHQVIPDAYFVAVDNASTDRTSEEATKFFKQTGAQGVLLREARRGKAAAVRRAFLEIEADVYVMVDADHTYAASDLERLIAPIVQGEADMVVGDRISGGDYARQNSRLFHSFGNNLTRWTVNRLFNAQVHDLLSGFRAYSRQFVKSYPIICEGFELETDMTVHAISNGLRLAEVPISYRSRPDGSLSKLNTYRDGLRILRLIFVILKDHAPLRVFGTLSILSFLSSLAAGVPVIAEFYSTRWVSHVPLAILATGLAILSVLSLAIGLTLETITRYHRKAFQLCLLDAARSGAAAGGQVERSSRAG